jgi:PST family polysaccharide transporter
MVGLGQVAARGAAVTIGAQGTRFVLQIASLAVISRFLTPAEVGLVAMVTAVLNVAEIIRDFGLSAAAIQAPTLSRAERSNLFWMNLAIGGACTLVAALSAPAIAHFYGQPDVIPIVLALSWLFVISGANTQYRADLSRDYRFAALAFTEIVAQALAAGVGIGLAITGAGSWAIVGQQITLVVATLVLNAVQCRWLPARPDRSVSVRRFLVFGSHLLGTNLMGFAVNNVDNIAIGASWGPTQLGLYSRAYQLVQVPLQQINAPLGRVVLPVLARVNEDAREFLRLFRRFQMAICLTLGLGFSLLAGLAAPVVRLLFGEEWMGVAPILAVLAIGGVFKGIDSANYQVWVAKGYTGSLLKVYMVSRPIMIVTILLGLPWGPVGVAMGHLVAAAGFWGFSLWYVCRLAGLEWGPLFAQTVRAMLLVIAPAGAIAHLVASQVVAPAAALAGGTAAACVWVLVVIACVGPLRRDVMPLWRSALAMARRSST